MTNLPIFQITLPLMVTFIATVWAATWIQNKRFDDWTKRFEDLRSDMNRRFDEVIERLKRIEERTNSLHR